MPLMMPSEMKMMRKKGNYRLLQRSCMIFKILHNFVKLYSIFDHFLGFFYLYKI